ncbi:MAG: hypothetical protein SH848_22545 [Saprospiraceae bacterium]|nr:hypothetical protein [Saprospiraceae bacterium]
MKSNFINLPLLAIIIGNQAGSPLLYCRQKDTLVIYIKNDHSIESAKLLEKEAFGVIP